jgi:hypothetical protein
MWHPAPLRLGYVGRPALRGPRLGQTSAVINQAASAVVSQAEPRVRAIVAEERSRIANATIQSLPYLGGALTAFLAAQYLVPADKRVLKGAGYVASAAIFTVGAWKVLQEVSGPEKEAPATSGSGGGLLALFGDTARQMAQVVVTEAEPKVRAIIADEKAKLSEAGMATLPFLAASTAGFIATAVLVPEGSKKLKFGGYMASAAALLAGLWRGLSVAS